MPRRLLHSETCRDERSESRYASRHFPPAGRGADTASSETVNRTVNGSAGCRFCQTAVQRPAAETARLPASDVFPLPAAFENSAELLLEGLPGPGQLVA